MRYGLWSSPIRLPGGWCLQLRQQSARCCGCGAVFRQSASEKPSRLYFQGCSYTLIRGWCLPKSKLPRRVTGRSITAERRERFFHCRIACRSPWDFLPLEKLDNLVFGGWDIFPDTAYEAARKASVLEPHHLEQVKGLLSSMRPMKAAFDQAYVKKLDGRHVKKAKTKFDLAEEIKD